MHRGFHWIMKTLTLLFATVLGFLASAQAAEEPKPLLQISFKSRYLDTDHDTLGRAGRSKQETLTLRVVLYNATSKTVDESVLTGVALVSRAAESREQIVKESLGEIKVPAMKPNEKLTIDLGKIELSELEWGKRKFEEHLEEWQVTCSHGAVEIGKAESSERFALVAKNAVTHGQQRPGSVIPAGPRRLPRR
jgi:hypothetical protein